MNDTEQKETVSLVQQHLNKKAEQKLKADIDHALTGIGTLLSQMDTSYRPIIITINGDSKPSADGKTMEIAGFVALQAFRELLKTQLIERYVREETNEFLSQIEMVCEIAADRAREE